MHSVYFDYMEASEWTGGCATSEERDNNYIFVLFYPRHLDLSYVLPSSEKENFGLNLLVMF